MNERVIRLREDRQLLVMQRSRPELLQRLNDVIGTTSYLQSQDRGFQQRICIIDAMAVAQTVKKGTNISTCVEFAEVFINIIKNILDILFFILLFFIDTSKIL